jgi:tRNA 2-thiocytidine biosynthesis protein TtcA
VANKSDRSPVERKLLRKVGSAIREYRLIEDGDRVLVALSGGKDSYALLTLLDRLKAHAPVEFELVPWHLDQAQPGYDGAPLERWLEARGGPFHIERQDTYSVVVDKVEEGATYCSLCSRLRRGILYNAAQALGCTKIALGHHGDDAVETMLLNMLFTGTMKAMPPWLRSDDGRNIVIRPLIRCFEAELQEFSVEQAFPILPCNLCGSQENLKRQAVKELIASLEAQYPKCRESMLSALTRAVPTHLLDAELWSALGIGPGGLELGPRGRQRLRVTV